MVTNIIGSAYLKIRDYDNARIYNGNSSKQEI